MEIYSEYMDPPEPPRHLWLTIDYDKIDFRDINHVKFIYYNIPETYDKLNNMYKIYKKNSEDYLKITNSYDGNDNPPKIMKKIKKK